ncbi:MAG: DUF2306 domain-containing protein [Alphaproteobacteria bacterium]
MLDLLKAPYKFLERYVFNQSLSWFFILAAALLFSTAPIFYLMVAPLISDIPIGASAFSRPLINNLLLLVHVVFAIMPLCLGPWLFHATLRREKPKLHRKMGQVYVICCLISAATSLPLGLSNHGGNIPRVGFGSLAVAWFVFTWLAYYFARQKNFIQHRRWMFRSYACTYAFVNIKIYGYLLIMAGSPFPLLIVKTLQSCVSWMSNLLIAEIYLAATTYMGVYVGRKAFLNNLRPLPIKIACFLIIFLIGVWVSYAFFPMID